MVLIHDITTRVPALAERIVQDVGCTEGAKYVSTAYSSHTNRHTFLSQCIRKHNRSRPQAHPHNHLVPLHISPSMISHRLDLLFVWISSMQHKHAVRHAVKLDDAEPVLARSYRCGDVKRGVRSL